MRRYDYNEVVDLLNDLGYVLLDNTYKNARTLLNIKDNNGYLYKCILDSLLRGGKPRIADSRNPYSIYNIILWLTLNNKDFILLSDKYIGKDDNLIWKCTKCNHIWNTSWHSVFSLGRECPNCNGGVRHEYEFIKSEFLNYGYILLDKEYNNVAQKLSLIDNEGYKYYVRFDVFKRSKNKILDKFSKFNPYTIQNIRLWCNLNQKPFELLSKEYIDNIHDLKWKCNLCNEIFYNAWVYVYGDGGCNLCTISKGENRIKQFLKLYNIEYIHQYVFDNCKNKRVLRFDFYLPQYNLCIEFNGKQHYESVDLFGGEEYLELRKKLDKIKFDYCINNNINILVVPYWDYNNIEEILLKELNNYNIKAGDLSA